MSGHNKWAKIKHKKGAADAAKGRLYTRLIKEITIAARHGGGNPDGNPRLRAAVNAARNANMPSKNIDNAIARGTGELPGVTYEEFTYEGYGPGGSALYIETVTDNKNRTVSELRHLLSKYGGTLGESGSVAWMFEKKGVITVSKNLYSEDDLMMIVLDAGADDMKTESEDYEIYANPNNFEKVKSTLESNNIQIASAEIQMTPKNTVKLEGKQAEQMLKLMEAVEEHDDVQHVYSNFDIDESVMENLA
jgi:YebC/PmpR family DNA-binding regulatory protein